MSTEEKRARFLEQLSKLDQEILTVTGGLDLEMADQMRENVIGITKIPIGLAENFIVNNKPVLVPIATEERSVVTQASSGAGLVNNFTATAMGNIMIGQIQVLDVLDMEKAKQAVLAEKESLLVDANTLSRSRKAVDI